MWLYRTQSEWTLCGTELLSSRPGDQGLLQTGIMKLMAQSPARDRSHIAALSFSRKVKSKRARSLVAAARTPVGLYL